MQDIYIRSGDACVASDEERVVQVEEHGDKARRAARVVLGVAGKCVQPTAQTGRVDKFMCSVRGRQ